LYGNEVVAGKSNKKGRREIDLERPYESELRRLRIETSIAPLKGSRYYELARQVLERLPDGWDYYREYVLQVSESPPQKAGGLAASLRLEENETSPDDPWGEQVWEVTLYHKQLFDLPDPAIKWVIDHELGHVASGVPCGSLTAGSIAYTRTSENIYRPITKDEREAGEFVADAIARAWGWWEEEQTFVLGGDQGKRNR